MAKSGVWFSNTDCRPCCTHLQKLCISPQVCLANTYRSCSHMYNSHSAAGRLTTPKRYATYTPRFRVVKSEEKDALDTHPLEETDAPVTFSSYWTPPPKFLHLAQVGRSLDRHGQK